MRRRGFLDDLIAEVDYALKTLTVSDHASPVIANPAQDIEPAVLSESERRHSEGLLRVDHTGEICAQALYRGQAFLERDQSARLIFLQASQEEADHLRWTRYRLVELKGRSSVLNPFWYGASFAVGLAVSLCGHAFSLGFVAETEEQVLQHLDSHLADLPLQDEPSRAILRQMRRDEEHHAISAKNAGGSALPLPIKILMKWKSALMTGSAYYF